MHTRVGEKNKSWFRSDRFYHTDRGWWFQTRENTELGPFDSHREAEQELCLYIRQASASDLYAKANSQKAQIWDS